jgi:hypothetical protein
MKKEKWEEEWDSRWTRPKSGDCGSGCCKLWEGKRDFMSEEQKKFIKSILLSREKEVREETLEKYTQFLLDKHYVDSDVYTEEPKAIDRFLSALLSELEK